MRYLFCLSFLLFFLTDIQAQNKVKGSISGKVADASTKAPVDYATITVYLTGSTKPVNGTLSNSKGIFKVNALPAGLYTVSVDFIGYKGTKIENLSITDQKPIISLGTIELTASAVALQSITVSSAKPVIENKIDKMVYNAEKDISSQGGVATDVLKKVPQVSVDVDGNVELQGSTSVKFLINGKPSTMFGNSISDALQSIPASQIQSIEVITIPGAKYDAQGTGGIINIILKKSIIKGLNGTVNLSAGTRLENGSANLNYRNNNFGLNGYISGNGQLKSTTHSEQNRLSTNITDNTSTRLLQNGSGTIERNGYQSGIGFDWNLTKKDNLNGAVGYHHYQNNGTGFTNLETITRDVNTTVSSDINSVRQSSDRSHSNSIEYSVEYKKTFKKDDQELNIALNSDLGKEYASVSQVQLLPGSTLPFAGLNSINPGRNNESEFTIDYTQPISDGVVIETGFKNGREKFSSSTDVNKYEKSANTYSYDPTQFNSLKYTRNVYAAYLSSTFSILKFLDIKAGGRYEYTVSHADYSTAHNVNIPSYGIFAPSLVVSHKINDAQSIKLSYTYRIERPDYEDLNPYVDISDPHNISMGNTSIRPEKGNNLELGYNHSYPKNANIYVALFYRRNSDDITRFTNFYPTYTIGDSVYNDVSVSTRLNINSEERMGSNISGSLPVSANITLRSNVFLYDQRTHNHTNAGTTTTSGFGYRMNINGTYQVNKDLAFEFFGNFRSRETNVQGTQTSFIFYNMAMRKQFFNKKLSLGLTTTNPFNHYVNQRRESFGANFQSNTLREIPFRSFGVNLMYKFGKLEFKKIKEEGANNIPEPSF